MDFQQAVPSPTQYGAPQVFGQQGGGQQDQISAMLAKAKQLLSSGQISADQYSQLASQFGSSPATELATSAGNMGSSMGAGAPLNILPGAGG